jgi:hypothetical protein
VWPTDLNALDSHWILWPANPFAGRDHHVTAARDVCEDFDLVDSRLCRHTYDRRSDVVGPAKSALSQTRDWFQVQFGVDASAGERRYDF